MAPAEPALVRRPEPELMDNPDDFLVRLVQDLPGWRWRANGSATDTDWSPARSDRARR